MTPTITPRKQMMRTNATHALCGVQGETAGRGTLLKHESGMAERRRWNHKSPTGEGAALRHARGLALSFPILSLSPSPPSRSITKLPSFTLLSASLPATTLSYHLSPLLLLHSFTLSPLTSHTYPLSPSHTHTLYTPLPYI